MEKRIILSAVVYTNEKYGVVKCKERWCANDGKFISKVETWYDVCLEKGNGDIVASFKTMKEAKQYIRGN